MVAGLRLNLTGKDFKHSSIGIFGCDVVCVEICLSAVIGA